MQYDVSKLYLSTTNEVEKSHVVIFLLNNTKQGSKKNRYKFGPFIISIYGYNCKRCFHICLTLY